MTAALAACAASNFGWPQAATLIAVSAGFAVCVWSYFRYAYGKR